MKINEIYVDGFGVWNDLRLRKLSPEITVFYGPNEAGKTTLMHFTRAMLYGVTQERRERYLPPREGGRPGGVLGLEGDDGPFTAARYADRGDDDRGRVTITLPDGEEQGDRLLREELESVDERTFNNVFAIGLDEINELGALEGAEAARWIYRLTSGLDRVSLYDVIQGLRSSRNRLLAPKGDRSVLGDLIARREKLETEIGDLSVQGARWAKLAIELDEIDSQSDQLETERREVERRARRIEIALGIKPLWAERERSIEARRRFDHLPPLPDKPIEQLEDLNRRAEDHQRQHDVLRGQRRALNQEINELGINEVLVRSCCRLDALAEQRDWLEALERQSEELAEEVERLDARVETEEARLAKLWRHKPSPEAAPELNDDTLDQLQPAAEQVAEAQGLADQARRELEASHGAERRFDTQLSSALTASEKLGLPNNIQDAGDLVATLRTRVKAEQKVDQAKRQLDGLEEEKLRLIDQQVIPIELFVLLATTFATMVIVFLWPWISGGEGSHWWPLAFVGGVGLVMVRYWLEENKAEQLDSCMQQITQAEKRVDEAQAECDEIEKKLPVIEGSLHTRLEKAEQHLEELEKMLPVEAERRKAHQKTVSAEEFYRSAKDELERAENEWRTCLMAVGLPDETSPSEIEKLASQYRGLDELRSRSESKQEEAERCEREYTKVTKRIVALAEESELVLEEAEPLEQLEHLLSEQRLQQGRLEHRKKLRERAKELRAKQEKQAEEGQRVEKQREALFLVVGADGEQAFRQFVVDWAEALRLDEQRARLTREIHAAIGKSGDEEDFEELMSGEALLKLDGLWSELTSDHEALEKRLRDLAARRGVLQQTQQELVDDASLGDKRVELGLVEEQIREAREQWRERAAVGAMLELIRSDYEQHRQPETLVEASKYLERLTRGRYPRVWTPLAEDVLLVDNQDGESLRVENLSRGAREQLYLSVRLALVAMYARRGVQLPMVLDDVLVNFDDGRARIAADVLSDFARDGHQLFVYTCHEHVWEMFKELKVDSRRLPVRYETHDHEPAVEEPETPDEIVEEVIESAVVEPEPVIEEVEEVPEAAVEAEYLPLEPVTEVREVVETVAVPVAETPIDSGLVEPEAIAYGATQSETQEPEAEEGTAYGAAAPADNPAWAS